jgi:adenine/guanine phosphoribosyltransferase-like PRPP-binding protein
MASYHKIRIGFGFNELKPTVDTAIKLIRKIPKKLRYQIVCCGISGQSIAWPISYKLQIPVAVIRKPNEKSHGNEIENFNPEESFIILDDLISTGRTLTYILAKLRTHYHKEIANNCKAIVLYDQYSTRTIFGTIPVVTTRTKKWSDILKIS